MDDQENGRMDNTSTAEDENDPTPTLIEVENAIIQHVKIKKINKNCSW